MLGTYFTFPELLLWIPIIFGVIVFFLRNEKTARTVAMVSALLTLAVSITSLFYSDVAHHQEYFLYNNVSYVWLPYLGSTFYVGLDGMGYILTLLTAVAYPIILLSSKFPVKKANVFFGLMLLTQAGLMGVFVAMDALVFYFFWELALIPVYFLCSYWGGEKRIQATFKFFIYTFAGSLLMLVGILYLYLHTPAHSDIASHSFSLNSFYNTVMSPNRQAGVFCLFFLAFAVKVPIFPFHSWQPDTYHEAPYPVVMVMSGLMVKMGVFAMIRWLLPIFPDALSKFGDVVMVLSIIGIVYASCIAFAQNDLKRLAAWSSIAHLGLMGAAIFSRNVSGLQGVMLEMFNHGINIIALWIVIGMIEAKTGVRKMNELGGLAAKSPALSIFFLIIVLANIALPLTNAFVSEFMMFNGVFEYNKWFAVVGALGIILSAVYMLNMMQKVFFGEASVAGEKGATLSITEKLTLSVLVAGMVILGLFPGLILNLSEGTTNSILKHLK